jgi:hypothetical protein
MYEAGQSMDSWREYSLPLCGAIMAADTFRIPSLMSLLFVYRNMLPALRRLRAETAGLVKSHSVVGSGRMRRAVNELEVSGRRV